MRITLRQLRRVIREQIERSLTNESTEHLNLPPVEQDPEDTRTTQDIVDEVEGMWPDALAEAEAYIRDPEYRRRVVDKGYVSEEDFDDFLDDVVDAFERTELLFDEAGRNQDAEASIMFTLRSSSYAEQLQEVPQISINTENIRKRSPGLMLDILVHELVHVEEALLNAKAGDASWSPAFKDELLSIIHDQGSYRAQNRARFDLSDRESRGEFANQVNIFDRELYFDASGIDEMSVQELRNRLRELRASGVPMSEALSDGEDMMMWGELVEKYGEIASQFLIAIDYSKDTSFLLDQIDSIAQTSSDAGPSFA
jgi:hypothetical protein